MCIIWKTDIILNGGFSTKVTYTFLTAGKQIGIIRIKHVKPRNEIKGYRCESDIAKFTYGGSLVTTLTVPCEKARQYSEN